MSVLKHPFAPVYDAQSEVLVLGTFPSVKSRADGFYYAHPQNRFWRVLAAVFDAPAPATVEEKRALLLTSRVALWDVCAACAIENSRDASIREAMPNDIGALLRDAPIRAIFANGAAAEALYRKLAYPVTRREIVRLPSTSPANAAYSLPRLIAAWRAINSK